MKISLFTTLVITVFTISTINAQVLNQLEIKPLNPTANDTILIISDFSYNGNCTFGLIDTYVNLTGSTILVMPLYCGYWDTTFCNSIDTFKVGPFPEGNYILNLEYHQGSVCPYSGFDATIYQLDTAVFISPTTSVSLSFNDSFFFMTIFPNPLNDISTLQFPNPKNKIHTLFIYNTMGQAVQKIENITGSEVKIENANWQNGLYYFQLQSKNRIIGQGKFIIQ